VGKGPEVARTDAGSRLRAEADLTCQRARSLFCWSYYHLSPCRVEWCDLSWYSHEPVAGITVLWECGVAKMEGGCRCGSVRWRIEGERLPRTYACHCLDCQTWSGSAFSQQAIVARERFECTGKVGQFDLPSS